MRRIIDWVGGHIWETATGVLGAALVGSVVLLATSGDPGEPEATPDTTTTTSQPEEEAPTETTLGDDPVVTTTEPPPTAEGVTAVVVDNVADVGFQIGLGEAELIIETPVEGGLTRFTALYGAELPELVGPVRSLRPVSADLLSLFRPVVFATGGQPFVVGAVEATGANLISAAAETFAFQSLERPQPYHLFVSPGIEVGSGSGLVLPWDVGEWPGGESVSEVSLGLDGGTTWRYEGGVYVRYRGGAVHEFQPNPDADPVPLVRETVILLVVNQKSAGYTDSAGADVPTFDVIGGGGVYVLHGGELIEGTWFRANQTDGYTFTDSSGNPIPIPAGGLHLAIVPDGIEVGVGG